MPKEYIITDADRRRCDERGGARPAVRVGWNPEGWVQIATVEKAGTEGANRPMDPTVHGDPNDLVDVGLFIDLDRPAINTLIATLRRARDAAYGRDE